MRFGLIVIGALVGGIPFYVAASTLLGVVGREPWMSLCLFVSLAVAGSLSFWLTGRLAAKNKPVLNAVSGDVRKTFGALTLLIGAGIMVWIVYNLFSPTPEFKGSYKSVFQFCVPLVMIWYGWVWLTRKPGP
jgi:hypothetical protein